MAEYRFERISYQTYVMADGRIANNLDLRIYTALLKKIKPKCASCPIRLEKKCNGATAITRGHVITGAETPPAECPLLDEAITV